MSQPQCNKHKCKNCASPCSSSHHSMQWENDEQQSNNLEQGWIQDFSIKVDIDQVDKELVTTPKKSN